VPTELLTLMSERRNLNLPVRAFGLAPLKAADYAEGNAAIRELEAVQAWATRVLWRVQPEWGVDVPTLQRPSFPRSGARLLRRKRAPYRWNGGGEQGERFQIGNNRGHINGWVGPNAIYWRLVSVAP
jgi:hypothetical protein